MKKIFLALLMLCFLTCGCSDKATILFNKNKITVENALNNTNSFNQNERIYYLVLIPKKIETRNIDIQVIKSDKGMYGYSLFWTHSARLKDEQIYYYDDYVVIPEKGFYIMKVYSKDKPTKPLCAAEFVVN